ncbi:MAG TPA: sugar phosphate isomerase/epimerase family protein [Phycisphaeraceae bacterium]
MKLGLFSVSYAGLWGQDRLDLPAFIDKAAALGYEAVMLMGKRPHLSVLDADEALMEAVRQRLAHHGIACPVVGAYTDFAGGAAAEVPWVEMQVHYVEQLAQWGAKLGVQVIRLFTAYEQGHAPPAGRLWEMTVAAIRECCDRAAAHRMQIAIQNHHDLGAAPAAMLELLTEVDRPNCRLGFDAWSAALLGLDLYETARELAPHVAITTNADYVRLPRYHYQPGVVNYESAGPDLLRAVPFGEGFIDYEAFFAGLIDGGFDGVASYEMCSPLRGGGAMANLDRCAAAYLAWMRRHVLKRPARPSSPRQGALPA